MYTMASGISLGEPSPASPCSDDVENAKKRKAGPNAIIHNKRARHGMQLIYELHDVLLMFSLRFRQAGQQDQKWFPVYH